MFEKGVPMRPAEMFNPDWRVSKKNAQYMQRKALETPLTGDSDIDPDTGRSRAGISILLQRDETATPVVISLQVLKELAQFEGAPIWAANATVVSAESDLIKRPIRTWSVEMMTQVKQALYDVLDGVGYPDRERVFHDNIGLTVVRMLKGNEWEQLTEAFHMAAPVLTLAGPAVVLSETWQSPPEAYPCENPYRGAVLSMPDVWVPIDCGLCAPCVARQGMETGMMRLQRQRQERQALEKAFLALTRSPEGQALLAQLMQEGEDDGGQHPHNHPHQSAEAGYGPGLPDSGPDQRGNHPHRTPRRIRRLAASDHPVDES
jgi:hypothetical protein